MQSVLSQPGTEVVVVDPEPVGALGDDPRIHHVPLPPGGHAADARNRALSAAAGAYVAFLDGGDEVLPQWSRSLATACRAADPDVVCWGALRLDDRDAFVAVVLPPAGGGRRRLAAGVTPGTYAVRRTLLQRLGGFRPAARGGPDADLARRLVGRRSTGAATVARLPCVLVRSRRGPGDDAGGAPSRGGRRPALVTVIVPTRNNAGTLPMQLRALAAQTYTDPWEVVVVDNGSTDRTSEVAASWAPRFASFRLVDAAEVGVSAARNAGAAAARGDLLAFCDADDVCDEGWLAAMAEAAGRADMVGGAVDVGRLSPEWTDEQPLPVDRQSEFLPFARGANCGIRRDVLRWVGGWSTMHRGAGEDMDLSWRAQLCGFTLAYAPGAVVHYRLRDDLGGLARQKWRYGLSGARLRRSYAAAGFGRRGLATAAGNWGWLLLHLPDLLRSPWSRRRWVRFAARLAGMAAGSVRERTLFP